MQKGWRNKKIEKIELRQRNRIFILMESNKYIDDLIFKLKDQSLATRDDNNSKRIWCFKV